MNKFAVPALAAAFPTLQRYGIARRHVCRERGCI